MSQPNREIGTFGHVMQEQGVTPAQRLEAAARRVMSVQSRANWTNALLQILSADNLAMLELMRPAMESRAKEYLESLAKAGEGEGHSPHAEQARLKSPSPEQSPQGGDAGHSNYAEQASGWPPASQQPAQAEGWEGQFCDAEQANGAAPSPPASITAAIVLRDEKGHYLPHKPGNAGAKWPVRKPPNPPRVDAETRREIGKLFAKTVLDTFMIGTTALGDCTPEMCRSFIKKNRRNAMFVEHVIAGVPDGGRIKDYVTQEYADEKLSAANSECL
jgi:hypothetical protein